VGFKGLWRVAAGSAMPKPRLKVVPGLLLLPAAGQFLRPESLRILKLQVVDWTHSLKRQALLPNMARSGGARLHQASWPARHRLRRSGARDHLASRLRRCGSRSLPMVRAMRRSGSMRSRR